MTRTTKVFILGGVISASYALAYVLTYDGCVGHSSPFISFAFPYSFYVILFLFIFGLIYGIHYYWANKKHLALFVATWSLSVACVVTAPYIGWLGSFCEHRGTIETEPPPTFIIPANN